MYSWEISQLLSEKNYNIDSETYINMCFSSPQLNHMRFEPYGQFFEMWDEDGNYWKFTVYRKDD